MVESKKTFNRLLNETDLMERHIKMLKATKANQPIGIIRLSEILNMPKHKVRYSLRLLEQDGLILATPDGAKVSDQYDVFMTELSTYLNKLLKRIEELKIETLK